MADQIRYQGDECRILHISADDRFSGTDGSFRVSTLGQMTMTRAKLYISEVTIPTSYYNVPAGHNVLYIADTDTTGPTTTNRTVTFAPTNYTSGTIASTLQAALIAAPFSLAGATVTYNSASGHYTIATGDVTRTLQILTDGLRNKMAQVLGFYTLDTATGNFSVNCPTSLDTLVSPNYGRLSPTVISIHSNLAQPGYCQRQGANVVGVIAITGAQGTLVTYTPSQINHWEVTNQQLASIQFTFHRPDINDTVQFNGQAPTVQLQVIENGQV